MLNFEHILFQPCLVLGAILLVVGMILWVYPPKRINSFYGYRTTSSMRNQQSWNVAQNKAAVELIQLGAVSCVALIVSYWFEVPNSTTTLVVLLLLLLILLIRFFIRVEKAIEQHTNSNQDFLES